MVRNLNRLPNVSAEIATTDADGSAGRLTHQDLPKDIPIHLFRRTASERWKFSVGLRQWLRANTAKYDLIHIHALWSFATAMAASAAQKSGVPYVVRPAGMLSAYTWERKGWKKRLYWHLSEQRTIARAAAFHVTSEAEATEVRAVRKDARVFLIPNGVDDAAFNHSGQCPTSLLDFRRPDANTPLVLFLSRLHPKKGIVDRLLPAIAAMRIPSFLAIAGTEDTHAPGYETEVRNEVARLGLQHRVTFLGAVRGDDRWSLFDEADVFVLPSRSENFGIVVAEAMARRCPVVVTDTVQSCTHVAAANAGEVVPDNVAAIAIALDRVLSRPEVGKAYGEAGRGYAERHFRWDQIAHQIRKMYDDCLAAR